MSQKTRTAHDESTDDRGFTANTRLSEESTRQRDSITNTGPLGTRTGQSDLIFFQGILPDINGDVTGDKPVDEQIRMCLDRLELMLENRNVTLDDVLKVEVQLTNPDTAAAIDRAYESRFDGVEFPPRTVVGVCSLPGGADVQLDVIAAEE